MSVSTTASMIGSQCARSHSEGSPISCGRSGNVTDVKPRSALRRISAAASAGSARYVIPSGTMRSGWAGVPLLEEPVVPSPDTGQTRVAVPGVEEDPPTEAGDHGREIHRGPDAVDVHVVHTGIHVVTARAASGRSGTARVRRSPGGGRRPRSCPPGCSADPRTPTPDGPRVSRRCGEPRPPARQAAGSRTCGRAPRRGRPPRSRCSAPRAARARAGRDRHRARTGVCPRNSAAPRRQCHDMDAGPGWILGRRRKRRRRGRTCHCPGRS